MATTTLYAPDISCNHCVMTVKRALGKLEGVSQVDASAQTKQVTVTYDAGKVSVDKIKNAMSEEGYPAK